MDIETISNGFLLILGILVLFAIASAIIVTRSVKEKKA